MPQNTVICLGELIVDMMSLEPGKPLAAVERFQKNFGGSPANVAVGLKQHDVPVRLWSKVGDDSFGHFLHDRLAQYGLATDGVVVDPHYRTGLALVGLGDDGDRWFEMHNTDSADQHLRITEVNTSLFSNCHTFHLGGSTLLGEETAHTALLLSKQARAAGCLVSFDPNIQIEESTKSGAVIKTRLQALLSYVDVLKMNRADWTDLLGALPPRTLLERGIALIMLTDGARGAQGITPYDEVYIPTKPISPVDATGAGDAFMAAFLKHLVQVPAAQVRAGLAPETLQAWGAFASRWARRIIRHPGATTGYFHL